MALRVQRRQGLQQGWPAGGGEEGLVLPQLGEQRRLVASDARVRVGVDGRHLVVARSGGQGRRERRRGDNREQAGSTQDAPACPARPPCVCDVAAPPVASRVSPEGGGAGLGEGEASARRRSPALPSAFEQRVRQKLITVGDTSQL